jgi:RNA polymerase sigma-70 factor (ECF subfamily)
VEGSGVTSDEDVLVTQAKAGDHAAFEAIVLRYQRQIYAFVYRMMGNAEDAYDLTQECFVRAYQNLPKTNADLNVSAWLHRIASNACLDVLRRRKRIRFLPWDAAMHEPLLGSDTGADPEYRAIAAEDRSEVRHVLSRMSERNRLALVLREYEGLSTYEIGEIMGVSRSAVKSILFRGREEFRRRYIEEYGTER